MLFNQYTNLSKVYNLKETAMPLMLYMKTMEELEFKAHKNFNPEIETNNKAELLNDSHAKCCSLINEKIL